MSQIERIPTRSGPVVVERRPLPNRPANGCRWRRGDIHDHATAAVAEALCPAGGSLLASDVARLLRNGPMRFPAAMISDEAGVW